MCSVAVVVQRTGVARDEALVVHDAALQILVRVDAAIDNRDAHPVPNKTALIGHVGVYGGGRVVQSRVQGAMGATYRTLELDATDAIDVPGRVTFRMLPSRVRTLFTKLRRFRL